MHKYIGRTVTIIYLDRHGQITQRRIRPIESQGEFVRAYDYDRRAPRLFAIDSILAVEVAGRAF